MGSNSTGSWNLGTRGKAVLAALGGAAILLCLIFVVPRALQSYDSDNGVALYKRNSDLGATSDRLAEPKPQARSGGAREQDATTLTPVVGVVDDCISTDPTSIEVRFTREDSVTVVRADATGAFSALLPSGEYRLELVERGSHVLSEQLIEHDTSRPETRLPNWTLLRHADADVRFLDRHGKVWTPEPTTSVIPLQDCPPVVLLQRPGQRQDVPLGLVQLDRCNLEAGEATLCWQSECGVFASRRGSMRQLSTRDAAGRIRLECCPPIEALLILGNEIVARSQIEKLDSVLTFTVDPVEMESLRGSVRGRVSRSASYDGGGGVQVLPNPEQRQYVLQPLDANQSFRIERLTPGPCWLIVEMWGYARSILPIEIIAGQEIDVGEIKARPGRMLQGRLRTGEGQPTVASLWVATVASAGQDRWIGSFSDAFLDERDGLFAVLHLPAQRLLLGVDDPRYASNPVEVDLTSGDQPALIMKVLPGFRVILESELAHLVSSLRIVDFNGWTVVQMGVVRPGHEYRLASGSYTIEARLLTGELRTAAFTVGQSESPTIVRF